MTPMSASADEEQFDAVDCIDCEEYFDENCVGICGECENAVCPQCESKHVCRED